MVASAKAALDASGRAATGEAPARARRPSRSAGAGRPAHPGPGLLPDGLFDFREMRIVDNELPFIIFTEKEYRVIHGLAIVYMWLIDADAILLEALERKECRPSFIDEYRAFARRVQTENPLAIKGKAWMRGRSPRASTRSSRTRTTSTSSRTSTGGSSRRRSKFTA